MGHTGKQKAAEAVLVQMTACDWRRDHTVEQGEARKGGGGRKRADTPRGTHGHATRSNSRDPHRPSPPTSHETAPHHVPNELQQLQAVRAEAVGGQPRRLQGAGDAPVQQRRRPVGGRLRGPQPVNGGRAAAQAAAVRDQRVKIEHGRAMLRDEDGELGGGKNNN